VGFPTKKEGSALAVSAGRSDSAIPQGQARGCPWPLVGVPQHCLPLPQESSPGICYGKQGGFLFETPLFPYFPISSAQLLGDTFQPVCSPRRGSLLATLRVLAACPGEGIFGHGERVAAPEGSPTFKAEQPPWPAASKTGRPWVVVKGLHSTVRAVL